MGAKPIALLAILLLGPGCLRDPAYERPFSRKWAHQTSHERAFEARKARIQGDEVVLLGEKGRARAAVEVDEKGKARLNLGKKRGLSADVKVGSSPELKLKYKLQWKGRRHKKETRSKR